MVELSSGLIIALNKLQRMVGWFRFTQPLRCRDIIDSRSIKNYVPQTLPVLQLELEAFPNE